MRKNTDTSQSITRVTFKPCPWGSLVTFIVGTKNIAGMEDVCSLFARLSEEMPVRKLAEGRITAYAVQDTGKCERRLSGVTDLLRRSFAFMVVEAGLCQATLELLSDLCEETGSMASPLARCSSCGAQTAFPAAEVSLWSRAGRIARQRCYCADCLTAAACDSDEQTLRELLGADEPEFWGISRRLRPIQGCEDEAPGPGVGRTDVSHLWLPREFAVAI